MGYLAQATTAPVLGLALITDAGRNVSRTKQIQTDLLRVLSLQVVINLYLGMIFLYFFT